jgi:hypothetical protein
VTFSGHSLGWGVLEWMEAHLPSPADPEQPFVLTDEQAEIVLRWYAVDEEGQFIHRRGALEMAKGWGKSPLAGAIAIAELVGPVVFDRWEGGDPIGRPWDNPVVEIAAVSEDQTDNTYSAIFEMLAANEHRAAKALGIDDGRTRLYLTNRPGILRPVTAASGSREGARLTFGLLDETHLWTRRNGGVKLAGTLRRNAAKMGGRTLETTNAPTLGEKSVAEQTGMDAGVMLYARRPRSQPDPSWSDADLLAALRSVYGDSYWITSRLDRIVQEIRDPATNWDDAIRFYFNIRTAGSGRAVDPREWDALAQPQDIPAGTQIGLGFDGSISRDATVLRACTRDGYSWVIRSWVRPHDAPDDWRVDRLDVAETIADTFARFNVGRMLADPPKWDTEVADWQEKYGEDIDGKPVVQPLDTNQARQFAPAVDRWLTAIREKTHTHDGDPLTDLHVKAAHLRKVRLADDEDDGRTRYVLIKGEDRGRIDAAVADVLAFQAAMTMPEVAPMKEFVSAWG